MKTRYLLLIVLFAYLCGVSTGYFGMPPKIKEVKVFEYNTHITELPFITVTDTSKYLTRDSLGMFTLATTRTFNVKPPFDFFGFDSIPRYVTCNANILRQTIDTIRCFGDSK